jgi:hypothetical protein
MNSTEQQLLIPVTVMSFALMGALVAGAKPGSPRLRVLRFACLALSAACLFGIGALTSH